MFDLLLNNCIRTQVSNEERESVLKLLLNSCVRTQVSNEELECLTCCKTAASGLRSVMRRERVFDLLLNSCVRTQVSNEERVSV